MKRAYSLFCIIFGVFLILIVFFTFAVDLKISGSTYSEQLNYSNGWMDENGNEVAMYSKEFPIGSGILKKEISAEETGGRDLCFECAFVEFEIYLNENKIYDFHPKIPSICGKYYGYSIVEADIPAFSGTAELSIHYSTLAGAEKINTIGFRDIVLQGSKDHILYIIRNGFLPFSICAISFIYAVVLLIIGVLCGRSGGIRLPVLSLGMVSMTLAVWTGAPTKVLSLITGNSAFVNTSEFFSLMIMPVPVLIFILSITESEQRLIPFLLVTASVLNTVFQVVFVSLGFADYRDLLKISHILILLGMALAVYTIVRSILNKKIGFKKQGYPLTALIIIFAFGLLDLVRYYKGNSNDPSTLTRIGLLLFNVILSVYLFKGLVKLSVDSMESERMRKLAHSDVLTGLQNRTAFMEMEDIIRQQKSGFYIFIHFDVNFLKTVNDNYGHAEGDRHIMSAAQIIHDSFGKYGNCFRVGGDEFFAVISGTSDFLDEVYEYGIKTFSELQTAYNNSVHPPIPLAIAHGMAKYDCSVQTDPQIAEQEADKQMYQNKRKMKSENK